MRNLLLFLFVGLFGIALVGSEALAQATRGDYDGNGRSDLSVALVNRTTGSTAWLSRLSFAGGNFGFWTFGVPGDALVAGNWFSGDNRTFPGVVFVRSASTPLEWYVKTPTGGEVFLNYGLPGDNIPNQGDLDCDGITDLTVVRNGTANFFPGLKVWYVAQSSTGTIAQVPFGLANDQVGTADMDGDGCQELVALREGFTWFTKTLTGQAVTQVQWGLPGDIPLWPFDFNDDGSAEYAITRLTGAGALTYIRNADGSATTVPTGSDTAIPIPGNFVGNNDLAWSERATGWSAWRTSSDNDISVFRHGISTNAIVRPDGSVVQPDSDARFNEAGGGGGGGGGTGQFGCDNTFDFLDGGGGALWKPVSDNTRNPVVLLPREYWTGSMGVNLIEILDSAGNVILNGSRRTCCPNGGRAHFDVPQRASQLNASAPITFKMYFNNGGTECRTVPVPTTRYD